MFLPELYIVGLGGVCKGGSKFEKGRFFQRIVYGVYWQGMESAPPKQISSQQSVQYFGRECAKNMAQAGPLEAKNY